MTLHFNIETLGDIRENVILRQTHLTSACQGRADMSQIYVRDIGQTRDSWPLGKRVTVDRDGGPNLYGGYLWRARRQFFFKTDYPDTLQRQWVLDIVDNNILFQKRIVHKVSNPKVITGPTYSADTYDDVIIDELVTNWLDLSTDGIDVTTKVHQVAQSNAGQPFYPINGGLTWGQAMQIIAILPAAVWGLTPDWELYYGDVDEPDAPFGFSDTPNGTTFRGYREATIFDDLMQGANDYLAIGFGKGKDHGIYSREIDEDSVTEHGLWQDATVNYAVWKQQTIDRIADRYVNGSPSSKRGHKDPRVLVECITHHDGLRAGMKVRFVDSNFGFDDVIPIRQMEMRFPNPDDVLYKLKLTHEIDVWNTMDPPPPLPPLPPIPPLPDIDIITTPGGCTAEICGVTDSFTRTETGTWRQADCGWRYNSTTGTGGTVSVDGSAGLIVLTDQAAPRLMTLITKVGEYMGEVPVDATIKSMTFQIPDWNSSGTFDSLEIRWNVFQATDSLGPQIGIANSGSFSHIGVGIGDAGTSIPGSFWSSAKTYTWTQAVTGSGMTQSITDGSSTYTDVNSFVPTVAHCQIRADVGYVGSPITRTVRVLEIDIPEINACTLNVYDQFDRTTGTTTNWGEATNGLFYVASGVLGSPTYEVASNLGRVSIPATTVGTATRVRLTAPYGPWTEPAWTMRARLKPDTIVAGGITSLNTTSFILTNTGYTIIDRLDFDVTNDRVGINGTFAEFALEADTFYNCAWAHDGTNLSVKVWADGGSEPASALLTVAALQPISSSLRFGVERLRSSAAPSAGASNAYWSRIDFNWANKPCSYFRDTDRHYFWGQFAFMSDSAGTSKGFPYGTTVPQPTTNMEGGVALFLANTWYHYVVTIACNMGSGGANSDYAPGGGLGRVTTMGPTLVNQWKFNALDSYGALDIIGREGDWYNTGATDTWETVASLAAGQHIPKANIVLFYWDPQGWTYATPAQGQPVRETPLYDYTDGTAKTFYTAYPYQPGSLKVYINNVLVSHTELDPATGKFSVSVTVKGTDNIRVTYIYGTGSYGGGEEVTEIFPRSGRYCETLPRTNGITYATKVVFIANSQEVTVNGLLAVPVTASNPNGQYVVPSGRHSIVMEDTYDANDVVRICYEVA